MSGRRFELNGEELEQVTGGNMSWNGDTYVMTYTHPDGSVTEHKILDGKNAWKTSCEMHAKLIPEDEILAELIRQKYIGE